jgi:hypothetical protein
MVQIIVASARMIEDIFCFFDKIPVGIGLAVDDKLIGADCFGYIRVLESGYQGGK